MKRLEDMTEPELHDLGTKAMRSVLQMLPKNTFVTILYGEFFKAGIGQYVSNGTRAEMIKTLREMADSLESLEDVPR